MTKNEALIREVAAAMAFNLDTETSLNEEQALRALFSVALVLGGRATNGKYARLYNDHAAPVFIEQRQRAIDYKAHAA